MVYYVLRHLTSLNNMPTPIEQTAGLYVCLYSSNILYDSIISVTYFILFYFYPTPVRRKKKKTATATATAMRKPKRMRVMS